MSETKQETKQETGFTLLLWNGLYGDESNFIVRDNKNNKYSYFTPGETKNLVWTDKDLTNDPQVGKWDTFGNETVSDLEDVVF